MCINLNLKIWFYVLDLMSSILGAVAVCGMIFVLVEMQVLWMCISVNQVVVLVNSSWGELAMLFNDMVFLIPHNSWKSKLPSAWLGS